ncbi:MAG: peroxiredoxin [Desulfurococcales archaeon]|nr:peroxiredoxin [Desulfurococcales archaeon]
MTGLKPGDKAPIFEATTHTGRVISLGDFRGMITVIYFYPRAMTPGCSREAVRFNELAGEFEKCGAVILGISTDPPMRNKRFAEKLSVSKIIFLSDPDGSIAGMFGVLKKGVKKPSAERVTFVLGKDLTIKSILRNIRPAERHADEALKVVREMC